MGKSRRERANLPKSPLQLLIEQMAEEEGVSVEEFCKLDNDLSRGFAANVDYRLRDLLDMAEENADEAVPATDDYDRPIRELPLEGTTRMVFVDPWGMTLPDDLPTISPGRLLWRTAQFLLERTQDLPRRLKRDRARARLRKERALRIVWLEGGDAWDVLCEDDHVRGSPLPGPTKQDALAREAEERSRLLSVEEKFGIQLPGAFKEYWSSGFPAVMFDPISVDALLGLENLWPGVPPRVFPVITVSSGDFFGLFYPRDGGAPFVVASDHEQHALVPLTSDLDRYFRDPDYFDDLAKDYHLRLAEEDDSAWHRLKINPCPEGCAELELLKPMSLNSRLLDAEPAPALSELIGRFSSHGGAAGAIRDLFREPLDLCRRAKWLALAGKLTALGDHQGAIQAVENCLTVMLTGPHNGNTGHPPNLRSCWPWPGVRDVLIVMDRLVQRHGDTFDRGTIPHQLRIARRFARRR